MSIRNKKELRLSYGHIRLIEKLIAENPAAFGKPEGVLELIRKEKRDIREYYRRQEEKQDRHCIKSGFEDYIELIELPEELETAEEAEEYFREYEYIYYRNTPYDCTGQLFTDWFKIFKRRGRYMAYHAVSMDI